MYEEPALPRLDLVVDALQLQVEQRVIEAELE